MTGFRSRAGRTFRAKLRLEQTDEGKWRVEFDEEWAKEPPKGESEEERAEREAAAARAAERHRRRGGRRGGRGGRVRAGGPGRASTEGGLTSIEGVRPWCLVRHRRAP